MCFFLSNMVVMSRSVWKEALFRVLGGRTKSKIKGFTICTLHGAWTMDNGVRKLDGPTKAPTIGFTHSSTMKQLVFSCFI
jgi:hypothetical protein